MNRLALVATMLVILMTTAGCAAKAGADAPPVATDRVDLPKSYKFQPAAITVKAGTTVTFTNDDNFTHSIQLLDPSPDQARMLAPGQTVTVTFATPGLVHFQCSLHPQNMQGTVLVTS